VVAEVVDTVAAAVAEVGTVAAAAVEVAGLTEEEGAGNDIRAQSSKEE
jgi:hypothetical protein